MSPTSKKFVGNIVVLRGLMHITDRSKAMLLLCFILIVNVRPLSVGL